jgi:CBS domain-containing protein
MTVLAKHIMTTDVITVLPDTILTKVKEVFETENIHHLPVVNHLNEVVGIISRLDYHTLLDHFTIFASDVAKKRNDKFFSTLLVKEVMTKNVIKINPEDKLDTVIKTFLANLFHALPVVQNNRLVGIITSHDIIKYLFNQKHILAIK